MREGFLLFFLLTVVSFVQNSEQVNTFTSTAGGDFLFLVNGTQVARLDSTGDLYLLGSLFATGIGATGGGSNGNGKSPSLIAWYPLNSHTNDMSGSGYNGSSSGCTFQSQVPGVLSSRGQTTSIRLGTTCTVDISTALTEFKTMVTGSIALWVKVVSASVSLIANSSTDFVDTATSANPSNGWGYFRSSTDLTTKVAMNRVEYANVSAISSLPLYNHFCWNPSTTTDLIPLVCGMAAHPASPSGSFASTPAAMLQYTVSAAGLLTMVVNTGRGDPTNCGDGVVVKLWFNGVERQAVTIPNTATVGALVSFNYTASAVANDLFAVTVAPGSDHICDTTYLYASVSGPSLSGPIVGGVTTSTGASLSLGLSAGRGSYSVFDPAYTPRQTVRSTSDASDLGWHHMAVTTTDSVTRFYFDGVEEEAWSDNGGPRQAAFFRDAWNMNSLHLGKLATTTASAATFVATSNVADVAVFNYPLSKTQVQNLVAGTSPRSV